MVDVIRVDVALAAAGCGGCWTGEVRNALQKLPVVDASSAGDAARGLMSMQPINWAGVCDSVVPVMPFGDLLTVWSRREPRLWSIASC